MRTSVLTLFITNRGLIILLAAMVGLTYISLDNYPLFHALAELFSIIIAVTIYVIAWYSRRFFETDYLLFTGISYLFIAALDLLHTLGNAGMNLIVGPAGLGSQLWIAARALQAVSLVLAFVFLHRRANLALTFFFYILVTYLLAASILVWPIFPETFIEGVGLTPFKIYTEYVIIALLAVALALLAVNRRFFDPYVLRYLALSLVTLILTEFTFTLYVNIFDLINAIGHLFKILAFYFLYKALIETGFKRPYNLLFRDLKQSEEALRAGNAELARAQAELEQRVVELDREISSRKQAEAEAQRYAAQLERSNLALQNFASIASHDLQEPLRKVLAFGERLGENAGDRLTPAERDMLDRMQNATARMQNMIQALLDYSRITTRTHPAEYIPLNHLLEGVLSDLELRIEETSGLVEVSALPTVYADPHQMRQLFQNLVGNALKFHQPGTTPVVKIYHLNNQPQTPASEAKFATIVIEDNGIGFDEANLPTMFQPFRRLVGRSQYEGSGMGLAICRKIIERHGGTISARSNPGEGTAFTITLPTCEDDTP